MTTTSRLIAGASLLMAFEVDAQGVRGVVVDRAEQPVAGVVVLLLDSNMSQVTRTLSDADGSFRLTVTRAGSYRLQTLRIGFRPELTSEFVLAAGSDVTRRLVLSGLAVSLDTIRVAGRSACRADAGGATFAIWEQVRTALTATQVTAGTRTITARTMTYRRTLEPSGDRVLSQRIDFGSQLTTRPWRSLSADSLRQLGYVVLGLDGSTTYHAPDLDVLLSDDFVEDHCLRIAEASDSIRVGVTFEPAPHRRRLADIEGTLWIDRRTAELRRLEFQYVNVSADQRRGQPSGSMRFARMANGAWVITHWMIRMPELETRAFVTGHPSAPSTARETRVRAMLVEGGELALVIQRRDTLWSRPPMVVSGSVGDAASGAAVPNARIALRGTGLAVTSDSSGRFRIANALPGVYTLEVATPVMERIGVAHTRTVSLVDSAAVVVEVPRADQLAAAMCGSNNGIVAGRVGMPANESSGTLPRVLVVAEWGEAQSASRTAATTRWRESRPDSRGFFRLCNVPTNTALKVRATAVGASAEPITVKVSPAARLQVVELILDRPAVVAATLTGVVLSDVNGRPIAGAEVAISGLSRRTLTDDDGKFRLSDIPPGAHNVEARRIGYQPLRVFIAFRPNATVERPLLLSTVAALDTVVVEASAILRSFEDHRRGTVGRFLTRADLAKVGGRTTASVLRDLLSADVAYGKGSYAWITGRGSPSGSGIKSPEPEDAARGAKPACYAKVYLDHTLISKGPPDPLFDLNSISPDQIEAIEYYSGPSQTPMKYGGLNMECGVVVIWTRRS